MKRKTTEQEEVVEVKDVSKVKKKKKKEEAIEGEAAIQVKTRKEKQKADVQICEDTATEELSNKKKEKRKKMKTKELKTEQEVTPVQTEPSEETAKERKAKKKKEKKKLKAEGKTKTEEDSKRSVTQALEYLTCWSERREEWKFQKTRQVWLLQNMYDCEKVSDSHFSILLNYLEGLQGAARETTAQKAEDLVRHGQSDDEKVNRAREVVQILS